MRRRTTSRNIPSCADSGCARISARNGTRASRAVLDSRRRLRPSIGRSSRPIWRRCARHHGVDPQLRCLPAGTPRMMIAYEPLEIIVTLGHDLHPHRPSERDAPHLHRRPRLARQGHAIDLGLFDRPLDRPGRGRPLRPARSRDPSTSTARAISTPTACRCTTTTERSSRSASFSTRPTTISCMPRSRPSTTPSRARGR